MLRRSGRLLLALGIVVGSLLGMAWFDRWTAEQAEQLRVIRSEHQVLEQQISLLKTPGMHQTLEVLQEDLDTLRIRLVEVLTQQPKPLGVLSVDYEHAVLSPVLEASNTGPVSVLRLELQMVVHHAVGFLEMLADIDEAISVWPHETQACMIHRTPQGQLQVACALDFYHWGIGHKQVSRHGTGEVAGIRVS